VKSVKVRGRFTKHELQVGLSEELPLDYVGPEQKYALSDLLTRADRLHYKKDVLDFEMDMTTDELVRTPERVRCYEIISAMPASALPEVEETLRETYDHYVSLAAAAERPALPPAKTVQATVVERVRT
jgi:hypothetical protein